MHLRESALIRMPAMDPVHVRTRSPLQPLKPVNQAALPPDSLAAALLCAAHAIQAVSSGRSLNDALLERSFEQAQLDPGARSAATDLCYCALRAFGRGNFLLSRLLHKPLKEPLIRGLLLAALFRLESRPDDTHTTVDQAVEATSVLNQGAFKALVNAVLRNWLRRREAMLDAAGRDEVAHWQHPRWWIARVQKAYPDEWQAVLGAGNTRPPMTLRVNLRLTDVAAYVRQLADAGIEAVESGGAALRLIRPVPVSRLPGFAQGLVSVQDLGSQRAAELLDLQNGMRVLDACAAPGGKTAHILERAEVELTALDSDAARLVSVERNLARLGLGAKLRCFDCRDLATWWDGVAFDRVLADVPCSASGVVRRHPDSKWLRRETDIAQFAQVQTTILDALWQVLASGGTLLYATCSVFTEENSEQVTAFAARHDDCECVPIEGAQALQLLPCPAHDGFFYALLAKRP